MSGARTRWAARSVGVPHSVRKPSSTTTDADWRWPQPFHPARVWATTHRLPEPLFGGRQTAALPDWSFCGVQNPRKTASEYR